MGSTGSGLVSVADRPSYTIRIDDLGAASSAIVAGAVTWCITRGRYDVARDLAQLADTLAQLEADDNLTRAYAQLPRTAETPWHPPLCREAYQGPTGNGDEDLTAAGELCTCAPGACAAAAPVVAADGTRGRCKTCGAAAVLLVVDPHGTAEARHVATMDAPPFDHPADFQLADGPDVDDMGTPLDAADVGDAEPTTTADVVTALMPYVCGSCRTRWPTPGALLGHRRLVHGAH